MNALGVVILGAGNSSRMGRPKLLLPWGNTTVIQHLLHQWRDLSVVQIGVVCAAENEALVREMDRSLVQKPGYGAVHRILNPTPEQGMFSSIQCAARWECWQPTVTHWAISLGDQPLVTTETLRHLWSFAQERPARICQPSRHGRPRHPVILPALIFHELAKSDAPHLKAFLAKQAEPVALCASDDAGLDLDLDTPEDYERALILKSEVQNV